jgi:hypothetical protein
LYILGSPILIFLLALLSKKIHTTTYSHYCIRNIIRFEACSVLNIYANLQNI